jgi:hypothetical protein
MPDRSTVAEPTSDRGEARFRAVTSLRPPTMRRNHANASEGRWGRRRIQVGGRVVEEVSRL